MKRFNSIISIIIILFFFFNTVFFINAKACKDILACGDATDGDFNLLLKVRDPSRPGLQVLCIVPAGYTYNYHHPWTGKSIEFTTQQKYIGVATFDDIIPNTVKAGMILSETGLAFGDADTDSNWKNPTRYAWDDFDWIRYACEKAENEEEAVFFLTEEAVDELHASGVSENLFVVGPENGYVIEADAFHYDVKRVDNGVVVMSNYPKELWKTQVHKKRPIASSFTIEKEKYVRKGLTLRLNSIFGVRIVDIGEDWITARQVPFFKFDKTIRIMGNKVKINLEEQKTVGDYSVTLLDIDGKKANIKLSYKYKAWEDKMMDYIQSEYGFISVDDMIYWSRLHENDLGDLRPMCEDFFPYEAVAIYKIPNENYDKLSVGWFAPNHACSSIYVPFHICNSDIYEPYKTGDAAEISLDLLNAFGHGVLSSSFSKVESVFLYETEFAEDICKGVISNTDYVSDFLTIVDMGMQRQAYYTEQLWMETSKLFDLSKKLRIEYIIDNLWGHNYSFSLKNMENAIIKISEISDTSFFQERIKDIIIDICDTRINSLDVIGLSNSIVMNNFDKGKKLIKQGDYENGFKSLKQGFDNSNSLIKGERVIEYEKKDDMREENYFFLLVILAILLFLILMIALINKKS